MNQRKIFIAGTDTEVGKTIVTAAIVEKLQLADYSVTALKPIAAGCEERNGQLENADALLLQASMNKKLSYQQVNPFPFKRPIAPHIAAAQELVQLSVQEISEACQLSQYDTDYLLIEGAGGWKVPLNSTQTYADFAVAESLDIILVVGMKLGCINHTLLSIESILASGANLIGWVANQITPGMQVFEDNLETLQSRINVPLIANIPYIKTDNLIQDVLSYVNIEPLA